MPQTPKLPFEASATLPAEALALIRPRLMARVAELAMPILRDTATELRVQTPLGTLGVLQDAGATRVELHAGRKDWLYLQKERFIDTLTELSDALAETLSWSDAQATAGEMPPNFQLITVDSIAPLPGGFLRVTATAQDLSLFQDESIHFRLALPAPEVKTPEWPYLSAAGKTIWPSGAATLHRPVYTVRSKTLASQQLVFDVYEHDGGRVTEWARGAQPGERIGLTGPGGGGIPQAQKIRFYSDETGFPAVARILESLPDSAQGHVALDLSHPEAAQYPIPEHPGFTRSYHVAGEGETLAERAIADLESLDGAEPPMIWLAARKSYAQALRRYFKAHLPEAKGNYIAGYWSDLGDSAEKAAA